MKNSNIEIRKIGTVKAATEKRAMVDGEEMPDKFGGIAAVVNQVTDMGWYEEVIMPGAFDDAINADDLDCRCLFNHEEELILGRTKSGTCRLGVGSNGELEYEYDADYKNPLHLQVARSIMRGDISQSSFAFTIAEYSWAKSEKYGDGYLRKIIKVGKLYDVSPVTYPAYEETMTEARNAKLMEERTEALKQEQNLQHDEYLADVDLLTITKSKF